MAKRGIKNEVKGELGDQKAAGGAPDRAILEERGAESGQGERGRDGWAAFPGLSRYLPRCENVYSQRLPLWPGVASADWQQAEGQ